jgi:hypothetical protein
MRRSNQRRRIRDRSLAVFARHAGQARWAASTARRVSAAPSFGIVPITWPVALFVTGIVLPSSASIQRPST